MTTRMVSKRRTQEEISGSSRDGACAQADESASPPEAAAQTCQRARGTAARVNNESVHLATRVSDASELLFGQL